MKKIYLFSLCLFSVFIGYSQSVSPEVTASGGDHFTGANVQLSWTVGEVMTETYDDGSNILTQGFHQPEMVVTTLEDLAGDIDLKVFPNPTPGLVNITYSNFSEPLKLFLYDALGRQLLSEEAITHQALKTIDLSHFAPGSYFLKITDQHSQIIKTFKILKNN